MSLYRQLSATRVEDARAESASIELVAGTPERALDTALPDTRDAMSKACCADLRSSRACSERAGSSFAAQLSRSVSRRGLTSSCPRAYQQSCPLPSYRIQSAGTFLCPFANPRRLRGFSVSIPILTTLINGLPAFARTNG
jgi:hypothetical protein